MLLPLLYSQNYISLELLHPRLQKAEVPSSIFQHLIVSECQYAEFMECTECLINLLIVLQNGFSHMYINMGMIQIYICICMGLIKRTQVNKQILPNVFVILCSPTKEEEIIFSKQKIYWCSKRQNEISGRVKTKFLLMERQCIRKTIYKKPDSAVLW